MPDLTSEVKDLHSRLGSVTGSFRLAGATSEFKFLRDPISYIVSKYTQLLFERLPQRSCFVVISVRADTSLEHPEAVFLMMVFSLDGDHQTV